MRKIACPCIVAPLIRVWLSHLMECISPLHPRTPSESSASESPSLGVSLSSNDPTPSFLNNAVSLQRQKGARDSYVREKVQDAMNTVIPSREGSKCGASLTCNRAPLSLLSPAGRLLEGCSSGPWPWRSDWPGRRKCFGPIEAPWYWCWVALPPTSSRILKRERRGKWDGTVTTSATFGSHT